MDLALGKQNAHIMRNWIAMIRLRGYAGHQRKNTLFPSGELSGIQKPQYLFYT